jgi:hypothetical protein
MYTVLYEQTSRRPNWTVREPVLWCVQNFGPVGPRWDWKFGRSEESQAQILFSFADESDSTQFKLAWL